MSDVLLAAYPRSGVTFLRLVIERLYGLPTLTMYREEPDPAGCFEGGRSILDRKGSALPVTFIKTHEIRDAGVSIRAIHLIRDGRDAIISHAAYFETFLRDRRARIDICRSLIEGRDFISWSAHTLAWLARPAARIFFDDLIERPIETVTAAVAEVAPQLTPNAGVEIDDFEALRKRSGNFFRSGRHEQWKTEWPADVHNRFWLYNGAAMNAIEQLRKHMATCRMFDGMLDVTPDDSQSTAEPSAQ